VAALDEDAPLPGKKKADEKKKPEKKKDRESPDFTVEVVLADGKVGDFPVSRFMSIPPPLKETFTKLSLLESQGYEKDWEPVFQTVRIPLGASYDVRTVRLKFDWTAMSVICISGLGFGRHQLVMEPSGRK
jgi:hypothetical protein